MRWFRTAGGWRGGGVLLLALALAVRLAAPTGWMLAPSDGHGLPQLVICTGHGAETLSLGGGDHRHAPGDAPDKQGSDHPCVCAGHAAPTPPTLIVALVPTPIATLAEPTPQRLADQRPGRGLAAPPPPSQGPPHLI
jgi:hypothetical protein